MALIDTAGSRDRVTVWECIGCGKIEGPQPCIGVCQDRKVEYVRAEAHDEAVARMQERNDVLESLVRRLAHATPRAGEWERSYLSLQREAQDLLGELSAGSTQTRTTGDES